MSYVTLKSKAKLGCKVCDKCCINRGDIKLTAINVIEISRYLGISIDEFIKSYTARLEGQEPELVLKAVGSRDTCILNNQTTNLCQVHPVKPMQCVTFPLIPVDLEHDVFYMQDTCPYDFKEEISVKEWLNGKNGIYLKYKKIYIEWIKTIENLQKNWENISNTEKEKIYKILYYDYDNRKNNIKKMVKRNLKKVQKLL